MKRRHSGLVLFIAVPVLIIALGILVIQLFLRSNITSLIENSLEEKIQASSDSLDINIQKIKFSAFPLTVLTPEISIYAVTKGDMEEDSARLYSNVYEAGVIDLEISLIPLVLIALGQKEINFNLLQADSVYFSNKFLDSSVSRLKFQSGPIRFKGRIELPGQESELTFEKHTFQAEDLYAYLPQKKYFFHIDSISLDGTMKTISMEKFKMLPEHSKEEFYRHVDFETPRIETHLDNIELKSLRTYKKQGRRGFMVSQVNIRNGLLDVFRDRRPPFNNEDRPAMPTRFILSAPVDIFVAEINISQTDILYSEFPEDGAESGFQEAIGHVPFNRMEATVRNITNISDSLNKDSIMHIKAETFAFEDANVKADFRYNLKDINGGYSADVNISEFRFEIVNSALYPIVGIRVEDGIHKSTVISFTGNDVETSGEMTMEWNDLLLDFTPEAGDLITGITQSLGKIIYLQSNPDNAKKSPTGDIYYQRDISRFIFHYWWRCYLSGIKNSVLPDYIPL